ncbi:MAG: hypothetical protein R3A10_02700 [Caldilineaceae bacterium]
MPRISLTLLLTVMAVILGLTAVATPLEPLTRLAPLIRPRDILEPKTILLLVWLETSLPLSGAMLLWLFARHARFRSMPEMGGPSVAQPLTPTILVPSTASAWPGSWSISPNPSPTWNGTTAPFNCVTALASSTTCRRGVRSCRGSWAARFWPPSFV